MEKAKTDFKRIGQLFVSTMRISAFTFGGGFVIVPLLKKRFVDELGWIEESEVLDLISVAQSSPGPIAVNASLMIGYRVAGLAGALAAALATVLPPLVIISVISFFYHQFRDNVYVSAVMRGMQAGVAAVICSVTADLGRAVLKEKKIVSAAIMAGVFIAVYFLKVNVLWVILSCGMIGFVGGMLRRRAAKKGGDAE